jgi:hypothetical protein
MILNYFGVWLMMYVVGFMHNDELALQVFSSAHMTGAFGGHVGHEAHWL